MKNVYLDSKSGSIIGIFEGFLEIEEHQSIGLKILDLAKMNSSKKLVIDTTKLKVMKQETQKWIEEVWFPKAKGLGVSHMAFAVPQDIFGKISTTSVNQKSNNIMVHHAQSLDNAIDWISKQ